MCRNISLVNIKRYCSLHFRGFIVDTMNTVVAIVGMVIGFYLVSVVLPVILVARRAKCLNTEIRRLKNTTFVLASTMEKLSLHTCIQNLLETHRQGILHITFMRRKGYILFRDGSLFDAYFRNMSGRDALLLLLKETNGEYYFEPRSITQPNLIQEPWLEIVSASEIVLLNYV